MYVVWPLVYSTLDLSTVEQTEVVVTLCTEKARNYFELLIILLIQRNQSVGFKIDQDSRATSFLFILWYGSGSGENVFIDYEMNNNNF